MPKSTTNNKDFQNLYKAILKLESTDECKKFFRDVLTISEINAMTERFKVAQMVDDGIPYREINKKTGSSTATITRVAHWLHHGKGGYRLILDRLK